MYLSLFLHQILEKLSITSSMDLPKAACFKLQNCCFWIKYKSIIRFLQWKCVLIWIRREICSDQAPFKSQNSSKQIRGWILMWETTGDGIFHWKMHYYGLWTLILAKSDGLKQESSNLILEGRCPSEFSSNLPQHTCLEVWRIHSKTLIICFRCVWLGLELNSAGTSVSNSIPGGPQLCSV